MFNDLVIRVKTRQFKMYNDYFSFFHSNSINKILTSKKIDQVILYRDLQFLDDETEYLKRAYYQTEAYNRIKKLISYYEKNMTPPSPILLTIEQYQYLDNRNRKILKLCIMKEKSQAQGQKQKRKSQSNGGLKGSNMSAIADILPKLDQTNLQNIADSNRDQSDQQSYDSDVHDVFENFNQKARNLFANGNQSIQEYKEVLVIRNVKESELVINFRTANQPPSDFNNCQNQPKIVDSSPPASVVGLKFTNSKTNKEPYTNNIMQQEQPYSSFPNPNQQSQSQSNFYPQNQQSSNQFQQGYQNSVNQNQNYQSGQMGMFQQQNQQQMFTNQMNYQAMQQQQNMGQKQMVDQNQFVAGYNGNMFQGLQKSKSPKRISNPSSNYQGQQASTANSSSSIGNNFTSMMQNSTNYNNQMGNNLNFLPANQGLSSGANNVNSPTNVNSNNGQNKKGKLSFMEYYHSVPNKSPSNILEKYMKRKK